MKNLDGLKCPWCKAELNLYGSTCYPSDGISCECPECSFEFKIQLYEKVPRDKIYKAVKAVWKVLK